MKQLIQEAVKSAMKAREKEKLNTLRSLLSAIQYVEMERGELDDVTISGILKSELKKRQEELEFNVKADRKDQILALEDEINVISSFLPQQLSADEIRSFINSNFPLRENLTIGLAIKGLQEAYPGRVDGKLASQIIKESMNA